MVKVDEKLLEEWQEADSEQMMLFPDERKKIADWWIERIKAREKLLIDSVMGIIVMNSEGLVHNLHDGQPGFAENVYLNLIQEQLEEIIKR